MKRVAIVGFGFMGRMHYGNWKKIDTARVTAICDANLAQLTTCTSGNLAGADMTTDFTGVAIYDDWADMLAAGGFDVVDITLPTLLHPSAVMAALDAGYDVLCEKPMALAVSDCDRMLDAARRTGKTLLVAHCLRFWPEYRTLRQLIESGRYGEVVTADFRRSSPIPDAEGPHGWFLDETKSGGCLLDLHIHDVDFILSLFGEPKGVSASAHRRHDGVIDHVHVCYDYPGRVITSSVSWAVAPTLGFEATFRVELERATVVFDGLRKEPFRVYPQEGDPFTPEVSELNAYEAELRYFIGLLDGTSDPAFLRAEDGRRVVSLIAAIRASIADSTSIPSA